MLNSEKLQGNFCNLKIAVAGNHYETNPVCWFLPRELCYIYIFKSEQKNQQSNLPNELISAFIYFFCIRIFQLSQDTVDGQNPAPPSMMKIPLFIYIGF